MKQHIRKIAFAALMAALVMAGSALRITLPVAIGSTTSFHLGNIMCALAGVLLGPVWGAGAAGIGSMLYDWTNPLYFSESWITLLTKAVYGLVAGLIAWSGGKKGASYARNQIASIAAALAYAFVYLFKNFAYNGLLLGGLTASAALDLAALKIPATIFNAVLPMIFTPILARAIRAGLDRSGIRL
jgi:uncharacterized membrane protein